jgi:hypothetical protein
MRAASVFGRSVLARWKRGDVANEEAARKAKATLARQPTVCVYGPFMISMTRNLR